MNKFLLIIVIFFLVLTTSCNNTSCDNIENIYVSELLINHTSNRSIDYCALLKGTINRKENEYNVFLRLEIYDGARYDHGITLSELIEVMGEDSFLEITLGLNSEERKLITSYLETGIENDNKRNGVTFKELFPRVHKEMKK